MTYHDLISHYGSQAQAARALGVPRQSVWQWKQAIPLGRQFQIELATGGALRADKPANAEEAA